MGMEQQQEGEDLIQVSFQNLEVLMEQGIASSDIQKLNDAGYHTVESIAHATNTLALLFAFFSAVSAFVPSAATKVASVSSSAMSNVDLSKAAPAFLGSAFVASPAFAFDSVVESLPSQTVALEVQFGAYLAVLLGTFLPVLFLINLYIQTESRKAGKAGGQDSE
ncbi:hypothetical protein TrRE_jg3082 [Triparma retinervis]|uniref:Uncharacterized protein n=1 Tax=Triparma retinervis TaxID=2557542 RepID=A0A9W7KTC9_9STRA|nr:hypothetical protein TrRE_jg3082 [Triparma retinervis]